MSTISSQTENLIKKYQEWYQSLQPKEKISLIHVDEVASKVASFYEKLRGVVDWREEHLLRKTAIERILKRRLFLRKNSEKIAGPLIYELIRGGHFPNNTVPESKIEQVQKLINKYVFILENSPPPPNKKSKIQLYNWILGIAACEVEETLSPPLREKALTEYMTELMEERVEVKQGIIVIRGMTKEEINTQIYIAVHRALLKLDSPIITYHLLKKRYSEWTDLSPLQLQDLAKNIYLIWDNIKNDLNHPLADKFYKVCERYDTPYRLLGDILSQDPTGTQKKISEPKSLERLIRKVYDKRLKTLKSRLARAAVYATISIFITNVLTLLAIEIPFSKYIMGQFNFLAIGVDVLGPTLLMTLLIVTIKPPKKGNLEQIIMEVMKIVYERERKDVYEIKISKKERLVSKIIITIFYSFTFIVSFGIIVWVLYKLHFPPLSYLIFIIFLCLIAFAGAKIRERSRELQITEEKETFRSLFTDLFALPVLQTGRWLSARFAKYNIIIVLFNSLIDMPFQMFTEFLEHWSYFQKEKKEKIH